MLTDKGAQGIDLKRIWRQFLGRAWIVLIVTVIGAITGFAVYGIYSNAKSGNTLYRIRNDYYIYLDYEGYPNGPDYYNAYTWDGILRDDPVVNEVLAAAPDLDKEQILDSVEGEILGDYRLLTVVVTGTDPELVRKISDAYKHALPAFAGKIDMILKIELWTDADIEVYDAYTRDGNAAFLGGLIGFIISAFALLIYYVVDDGIYSERDWVSRYPDIVFLGEKGSKESEVNTEHILGNANGSYELSVKDFEFNKETFDKMRASDGVILNIRRGRDKGEIIDKVVYTLKKQDIRINGVFTQNSR